MLNVELFEVVNSYGRELPDVDKNDLLRLQVNENEEFKRNNVSLDVVYFPSCPMEPDLPQCRPEDSVETSESEELGSLASFVIFDGTNDYPTSTRDIYCLLHRLLELVNSDLPTKRQSIILYIPSYLLEPLSRFRVNDICGDYGFYFQNMSPNVKKLHSIFDHNEEVISCMETVNIPAILTLTKYQKHLTLNETLASIDKNNCYLQPYLERTQDGRLDTDIKIRKVAPRYYDYEKYFPELKLLLDPTNLAIIATEAKCSSERWIDWPETTHYNSGLGGETWTVFPFCHTFPATDPASTKFINLTCEICPQTAQLLQSKRIRPKLRTALFSRLGPKTCLGLHTGWEDLANHVLRVHIPLTLPAGDEVNLCGTWVEGSIQYHKSGEIIVFDDSKVHRAFNYSNDEERLILILDMERPSEEEHGIPIGTAVGGHTDELDAFINSIT